MQSNLLSSLEYESLDQSNRLQKQDSSDDTSLLEMAVDKSCCCAEFQAENKDKKGYSQNKLDQRKASPL